MKNKVTIITPTSNSASTIIENLASIKNQNYDNWEHIIVDNKSTDRTLEIIKKKNREKKIRIISEKDKGIYDAINKGIKLSKGDIISILHSDDFYNNKKVLSNVVRAFDSNNVDIIYGNLIYVRKHNIKKILRFWKSASYKKGSFHKGWSPPHPSFFVKKKIHSRFGDYKINIGNSADVELMYRFLELKKIKSKYLDQILIKMRYGGKSNNNLFEIFRQNLQILDFLDLKNPFEILNFIYFKMINRIQQIIKKNHK